MKQSWLLIPMLVLGLVLPAFAGAESAELPAVDPSACTIEAAQVVPGSDDGELNAVTPEPPPIVVDAETPADPETVAAITERIAQSIACQNAGDLARMIANFSSTWIAERFSGYDLVFMLRYFEAIEHPQPLAAEDRIELVGITDILLSDDGRAFALVTTSQHGHEQQSLLELVHENDGWLIQRGQIAVND